MCVRAYVCERERKFVCWMCVRTRVYMRMFVCVRAGGGGHGVCAIMFL